MLRCLIIKRRLYEYLDGGLSDIRKIEVKSHLEHCAGCRERLGEIENILMLASNKDIPRPNDEFWNNFTAGLDRRLNEKLVRPIMVDKRLRHKLVPAVTFVSILIFFLALGGYFYKHNNLYSLRPQDKYLVEEIMALDDIGEEVDLNSEITPG